MRSSEIKIDTESRVLTIYGIRYTFELFQHLGAGPLGHWMRIIRREDGVVTIELGPGPAEAAADHEDLKQHNWPNQ